jgi:hypothetical protein
MKNNVSIWEFLGACALGFAISAFTLGVYFYLNGGF